MFELRNYQKNLKNEIRSNFLKGNRRVILCSPTGSGKTVTFASIAADAVKSGTTVVIVVDRRELLSQSREKLIEYGLTPALITAGQRTFHSASYIATVETLVRRPELIRKIAKSERLLIIIDECHKQSFDKIHEIEMFNHAFFIGATATPKRSGKQTQLSKYYGEIVHSVTIRELIADGFLVPAITYGERFDVSKISVKGGEFETSSMFNQFNNSVLYSDIVNKYRKHANGTKTIVFCVNVEHSLKTRNAFRNAGIRAEHIDGATPTAERNQIIRSYKNGMIDVLCNCDILTTGFDDPATETIIVNRATKSLTLWLQICGRGSRPFGDKVHFNIIDLGGNVFRLGFWESEREFSLHHKTKEIAGETPLKECPNCSALVHASVMLCKHCGHDFPKPEIKTKDGDLSSLIMTDDLPDHLKSRTLEEMSINDLEQIRSIRKYKIGWIVRLIMNRPDLSLSDYAELKGYKTGWIKNMQNIYSKI